MVHAGEGLLKNVNRPKLISRRGDRIIRLRLFVGSLLYALILLLLRALFEVHRVV